MADMIKNVFQSIAAAWEINERLVYHSQAGRMLAGLKFDAEGTFKVDGYDDLPLCQPWNINIEEGLSAGAPKAGTNQAGRKNQPVSETLTLTYRIATSRKHGWFRRDPTDNTKQKGFLEWIVLIRDAMETVKTDDLEDSPDASVSSTAFKPMRFSVRETETTQLVFSCFLEVEILVPPYCRAERSFTRPEND